MHTSLSMTQPSPGLVIDTSGTGPLPDARPFRFVASLPAMGTDPGTWIDRVRRMEDLGFWAGAISDHFVGGWSMDVFVALTAAALATTRLRLMSLVLCNDYRHPVLVSRSIGALDVMSGGRAELGIGAGWLEPEYRALGIAFDAPAVRVERLGEAVAIIRGLYGPEPLSLDGRHYQIAGVVGRPTPVQVPGPPIVVGGGSRSVLELAGRSADRVSFLPPRGPDGRLAAASLTGPATARRIGHVRSGALAAGRDPDAIGRQIVIVAWDLAGSDGTAHTGWSSLADRTLLEAGRDGSLPGVLAGSTDTAVERLERWREEFGFSEVHVGSDVDAFAPIVARLAGR